MKSKIILTLFSIASFFCLITSLVFILSPQIFSGSEKQLLIIALSFLIPITLIVKGWQKNRSDSTYYYELPCLAVIAFNIVHIARYAHQILLPLITIPVVTIITSSMLGIGIVGFVVFIWIKIED